MDQYSRTKYANASVGQYNHYAPGPALLPKPAPIPPLFLCYEKSSGIYGKRYVHI
jgi:hypothetical protein